MDLTFPEVPNLYTVGGRVSYDETTEEAVYGKSWKKPGLSLRWNGQCSSRNSFSMRK